MAKAKKPTRKELLKEPDEFLTLSRRMIQFSVAHKKPILLGIVAFFGILVAVAGVQYYTVKAENRAFSLLHEATAAYEQAASAGNLQHAHDSSAQAFKTLLDRHSGRTAAKIGRVIYADICYRGGDPATAAALYQEALNDFRDDPALHSLITTGLAYAWEARGDLEKAAAFFRQILDGPSSLMKEDAQFQLADLSIRMGRLKEGTALYQKIAEEHPDSLYGQIAKEKAARLDASG
ncbi:MAG: tetratricopeptide repeat protein [Desulfobacterales bacterium]|nr:tetratricopeptide repeat protein [Desulfobacterales bacterium]